ncbi:target of Nesh-SH3 isoform X22 [Hyla sarda]|uniref:target of Nesh-SH3 isoform X22 n=1 Tax=Hyla sarda TaxID=327740 RepID=UPI0024C36584|nr:target of Nesh-SH3 isoform X22 [Hyla sarda]
MVSRLSLLLFCGIIGAHLGDAQKLPKVKKLNMKAYINVTGDTLIMRFHRPNQNIKLEGFILGYGSNYFSNQYIQWPDNGKSYITDVDAETRYLIAVKPNDNPKKSCKEKNSFQKPLQLVIGTLSPTSVFLSWGILINPQVDWSALNKCPNDRFYTVRYREKNKDWLFQLCPTTETVIENLKPNTVYEFGVKDNSEDEIWSKPQTHKTSPKGKENGNIENNYKIPKGTLQYATEDTKAFVPVTKVKQGFHNLTKSTPPPTGKSPVYRGEIKKPYVATTTTRIATPKPKPVTKSTEAPPVSKPSEKPAVEHPKPAVSSQPVVKSFTPDSSTGTLEWVRATMVTHPFFQVTKIPIESSARDEPTASLVVVKESDGTQDESADMAPLEPILTMDPSRDKLVSPTITLFPYSKEIPSHQQEKALANERLATYMPQDTTVPQFIPGHPLATGVPQVSPLSPIKKYMTTLATTRQIIPAVQSNLPSPTRTQATTGKLAFTEVQHSPTLYGSIARTEGPYSVSVLTGGQHIPTSYESIARTEAPQSVSATSVQQRTRPPRTQTKTTKVFTGGQHIPSTYESIARTEAPQFVSATATQMSPVQQRTRSTRTQIKTTTAFTGRQHIPSTYESITRTEAPHSVSVTTTQMSPIQQRTRPPRTQTTATMGGQHVYTTHESIARTEAPHSVSDPRTTHSLPTDDLGYDIFEHSKIPLEANKTEKASSPKFNRTTKSPTISTVIKPVHTKKMPINLISLQIFADPTLPSEKTETQTISPPIPKTTQSNKILYSKPAPKSTQRVPINFISLQIFEEPDAPLVPNTTQRLYQPTTTQKPESPPQTKPVPTQKVSSQTTKKPKPTRRTKPASTGAPKETAKPKQPHVIHATTLAPYRLQHNSSRPKTSLRPRTRPPATNGTTQGPVRSRPNGEFNWQPGTIPGGRVHDTTTRILGATRNTSMESNNTGKRTFSVSSPPLPPVRPTYIRRRIQPSNVTGRPGVSVSSPPHLPVKPTTIRRKPPSANETGRPGNQGGILIPRASSATKPECAVACIKSPTKQPTLPAQEEDLVYSTVFSPSPKSDIDALGKTRYTAPHVVYMSKNDSVPCSITDTLQHFSTEEENLNQEITSAPQNPPTNLTVVTVEGCSSFVVIQWDKPNNDTVTEYNLISKENGGVPGKDESIITTNQTHSTVENLKPDTSYEFKVIPINPLGEGPGSATVGFNTESADPRVSEPVTGGKDAIWTEIKFKADSYSECRGKQYVKRTWYKKFVGIQLCNSLRYKIYLSDTLSGTFYNIGDQSGFGEDHCQFVDSFLEGRTGQQLQPNELEPKKGFYRAVRQQPVDFGDIGGSSHISYVHWYECGKSIPGKW